MAQGLLNTHLACPDQGTEDLQKRKTLGPGFQRRGFIVDLVESFELSLCITIGCLTLFSYVEALFANFPSDVLLLAKLLVP